MSRVIIFSRFFPAYHPRKGEPTYFVEKILKSINDFSCVTEQLMDSCDFLLSKEKFIEFRIKTGFEKHHTIRAGNRWEVGDKFSPRVWSGKPYRSKQITIAPDIKIKKVWPVTIHPNGAYTTIGVPYKLLKKTWSLIPLGEVAKNDGLSNEDFINWFSKEVNAQIICWSDHVNY